MKKYLKILIYDLKFFLKIPNIHKWLVIKYLLKSKSQLRADLFVLTRLNFKKNGFFVEFGAADGKDLSNTYLLEKEFAWTGILAEPAQIFDQISNNRPNSKIEKSCVYGKTGLNLEFRQVNDAKLSALEIFADKDFHAINRKDFVSFTVQTISLNDLLKKYEAPYIIDYLSIDTEGSEYEILKNFAFNEYDVRILTVEHNYNDWYEDLRNLLISKGYSQQFSQLTKFDSWWVKIV